MSERFLKCALKTELQTAVDRLFAAYAAAIYTIDDANVKFSFRIGEPSSELNRFFESFNASCAAVITAENPCSKLLPQSENDKRQAALIELVRAAGYQFFRGYGADRNGDWTPEQSVLILEIKRAAAFELAQKFAQNAFVYLEKDKFPVLINCLQSRC